MNTDLKRKLGLWDGVHVDYLKELYNANSSSIAFFENLVKLCIDEKDLQISTTWLIKHHYDNRQKLPEHLTEKLLVACKNLERWEAKLHLLQLVPHFNLTDNSIIITDDFVRECLIDSNKFVRAWAYNALYELTKYIPELKSELEFMCHKAMETESEAIKSKVRKILLELNK